MNTIQFGARVEVSNIDAHTANGKASVRRYADSLAQRYAEFDEDDLQINLSTGVSKPPILVADTSVRTTANKDRCLKTSITRMTDDDGICETMRQFFGRVQQETDKLIKAAGLKPDKK